MKLDNTLSQLYRLLELEHIEGGRFPKVEEHFPTGLPFLWSPIGVYAVFEHIGGCKLQIILPTTNTVCCDSGIGSKVLRENFMPNLGEFLKDLHVFIGNEAR